MKLSKKQFMEQVMEILGTSEAFCKYKLSIKETLKNNGIKRTGICIEQEDSELSPILYIDYGYEQYKDGATLKDVVKGFAQTLLEGLKRDTTDYDQIARAMFDYKMAKSILFVQLVNFEANEKRLEDVCYEKYLDFAIIVRLKLALDADGITSTVVKKKMLQQWGIEMEQLLKDAVENTKKLFPSKLIGMNEMLGMYGEDVEDLPLSPLYVLTNTSKINGATTILYPGELEQFAEKQKENLYVIPSSIHETLLLKESEAMDIGEMKTMVKEINEAIVNADEVLSNHVYFYDRKERKLSIAQEV